MTPSGHTRDTNTFPKLQLQEMIQFLDVFRQINDTVPLQVVITFLHVAAFPGSSMKEIAALTFRTESTTSRHLLDLGERNRFKEPGYDLVRHEKDNNDLRRNYYKLTPKGQRLVAQAVAIWESRKTE